MNDEQYSYVHEQQPSAHRRYEKHGQRRHDLDLTRHERMQLSAERFYKNHVAEVVDPSEEIEEEQQQGKEAPYVQQSNIYNRLRCTVEGCDKFKQSRSGGMCRSHYNESLLPTERSSTKHEAKKQRVEAQQEAQRAQIRQEQRQKKKDFLTFIGILMKYLESKDEQVYLEAKSILQDWRDCSNRLEKGDRNHAKLADIMKMKLLRTAGETYWKKAETYFHHYMQKQQECNDSRDDVATSDIDSSTHGSETAYTSTARDERKRKFSDTREDNTDDVSTTANVLQARSGENSRDMKNAMKAKAIIYKLDALRATNYALRNQLEAKNAELEAMRSELNEYKRQASFYGDPTEGHHRYERMRSSFSDQQEYEGDVAHHPFMQFMSRKDQVPFSSTLDLEPR